MEPNHRQTSISHLPDWADVDLVQTCRDLVKAAEALDQEAYRRSYMDAYSAFAHNLIGSKRSSRAMAYHKFFCYAASAPKSYSQIWQDLFVIWLLKERRSGYFLEIGAGDGVHLSNSLLVEEEYGWEGLLVEPNPLFLDSLSRHRNARVDHRCVTGKSGEAQRFGCAATAELSRVMRAEPDLRDSQGARKFERFIEVPSVSPLDLLSDHAVPKHIDYLSVDIEGLEYEVLQAFPFEQYKVDVITVEHNFGSQERRIETLLASHGFRRVFRPFTRYDAWFVAEASAAPFH